MKKKLITIALSSALALSTVSVGVAENFNQPFNLPGSQHGYNNLTIDTKQSQTNPNEYTFKVINPEGNVHWSIDGHNLDVDGSSITHEFTTPGSHKVSVNSVEMKPYSGGVEMFTGSTTVNVKPSTPASLPDLTTQTVTPIGV
ncbi:hypothetical protein, partial [Facilibium subflavum]